MSDDPRNARPEGPADPIEIFEAWHAAAHAEGIPLAEAMALATATAAGAPSVRMVLLKGVDERGFQFFTNYGSRKAAELDANPRASLCAHWAPLERQVRVEGPVERLSREESDAYFRSRPRGSQVGAWASEQSRPLDDRETLENRVARYEAEFEGGDVPLPPHWGGYLLVPERIEFWQGRGDRLHDRWLYARDPSGGWTIARLYP